ncbi:MAG TPA: hypothetical protein H9673_04490 [Candidatus Adamsella sp.]|nr:hypothetical protein [Candidatus Adamsella sp.]
MFICKHCKSKDKFELMFSPDYKGERTFTKKIDKNGNLTITVGDYSFTPSLEFMNAHAVCSFCSHINIWGLEK